MRNNLEEKNEEQSLSDIKRFLAFSCGQEHFAIPLLAVKEVIALPEFTPIPHTPPHFLGIMNLRGQIISVMDLRLKFNMKSSNTVETAVIICDLYPICVGVVVDSVNSVLSLSSKEILPKPEIESTKKTDYIIGVSKNDKRLVVLIDIAKVLNVEDLMHMKKAAGI
jgi:purine-binding chemotaxis protein CheW